MADSTNGARLKKRNKNKKLIASRLPVILVVAMVIVISIQIERLKERNNVVEIEIEHSEKTMMSRLRSMFLGRWVTWRKRQLRF
jgi:hypothetical protein